MDICMCGRDIAVIHIYLIWECKGPDKTMDGKRWSGEGYMTTYKQKTWRKNQEYQAPEDHLERKRWDGETEKMSVNDSKTGRKRKKKRNYNDRM